MTVFVLTIEVENSVGRVNTELDSVYFTRRTAELAGEAMIYDTEAFIDFYIYELEVLR